MRTTTVITRKGQVTIPIAIRTLLGLKPFDRLVFTTEANKIVATPVKADILSLYGSVKKRGRKPVDFKKLRQKMVNELAAKIASEGT